MYTYIFEHGFSFRFYFFIKLLIFGLIMPGAPVMEMTVNTTLNLDMHH